MNSADIDQDELHQALQSLRENMGESELTGRFERIVHELQLRYHELAVQNRSLRAAQAELGRAVNRYADLYDCLPIGYVTLDRSGVIVEANLTTAEILKHDRTQLIGASFSTFLEEKERLHFSTYFEECLRGNPPPLETDLVPCHGRSVAVQLCSRRATSTPQSAPLIRIAITDISRIKKSQHDLEEVNREQEAFAYSISHDLRSPLVTIISFADLLNTDQGERLDEGGQDMLFRIRRAAQRMDQVLQSLLQYSRLSRSEIRTEPVQLAAVLREVISQHQGIIKENAADIRVESHLPAVRASPELLAQALGNLLTNAIKYHEKDRAPIVKFSATDRGDHVVLQVADEGIGIAPEYHERIFKIFERLHSQSTYPGTGIGLAVVQRAVERMNGRVWVESNAGQGSCFNIALPKP